MDNPAQPKVNFYITPRFSFTNKWLIISLITLVSLLLLAAFVYQKSNFFQKTSSKAPASKTASEIPRSLFSADQTLGQIESIKIDQIKYLPTNASASQPKLITLGIKTVLYKYTYHDPKLFLATPIAYSEVKPGDLVKEVLYDPDGSVAKVYIIYKR